MKHRKMFSLHNFLVIKRVNVELQLTLYKSSTVCGQSKLVLGLYCVRSEAGRRHISYEQYCLKNALSSILSPPRQTKPSKH